MMIAEESFSSETKITGMREMGGLDLTTREYGLEMVLQASTRKIRFIASTIFNLVTFSFMYAFFLKILPLISHDEVVHGKKSLMHKMWGDRYNQFAEAAHEKRTKTRCAEGFIAANNP